MQKNILYNQVNILNSAMYSSYALSQLQTWLLLKYQHDQEVDHMFQYYQNSLFT